MAEILLRCHWDITEKLMRLQVDKNLRSKIKMYFICLKTVFKSGYTFPDRPFKEILKSFSGSTFLSCQIKIIQVIFQRIFDKSFWSLCLSISS